MKQFKSNAKLQNGRTSIRISSTDKRKLEE